jgi:release factor glutamine methyltransferase
MNNRPGQAPGRAIGAPPTLAQAVRMKAAELDRSGVAEPAREARLLACHAFDIGSIEWITNSCVQLTLQQMQSLDRLINRRISGEPIGRIVGEKEFYGCRFFLSADTLEPRTDTETLVDVVRGDMLALGNKPVTILDIGTGTGAIIVSLLCNLPNATGAASDVSVGALKTARKNAALNAVEDRILFVKTSWSEGIEQKFSAIVSNPPYIRSEIIPTLAGEVKDHDPYLALNGGKDGLDAYREIFTQCSGKLNKAGKLYLEIGYDQSDPVRALAGENGWKFVRLVKDYGKNDRVLVFEQ